MAELDRYFQKSCPLIRKAMEQQRFAPFFPERAQLSSIGAQCVGEYPSMRFFLDESRHDETTANDVIELVKTIERERTRMIQPTEPSLPTEH
mmetsp:Transcript_48349/g.89651  ORF Transcript_48349/g.89651 Transcript_48349/m.89651 type:complete len:92 (-) Transcript_48349:1552-1827(-)